MTYDLDAVASQLFQRFNAPEINYADAGLFPVVSFTIWQLWSLREIYRYKYLFSVALNQQRRSSVQRLKGRTLSSRKLLRDVDFKSTK